MDLRFASSLVAVFLLSSGGAALAQEGEDAPSLESLRDRLDRQERELQDLRKALENSTQESTAPVASATAPGEPSAQEPAPQEGPQPGDWTKKIRISLFSIGAEDKSWYVALRGRLQSDYRALAERGHDDFDDHFQMRRARIEVRAQLYERVTFDFGMEFGRTSDADLRNAYLGLKVFDGLRFRAGQMLLPYSDERLTSSKYLLHPERAMLVANMVGQRDIGFLVHGSLFEDRLYYQFGVFNGAGQNTRIDTDDDVDGAGRLEFRPFGDESLRVTANYIYTPSNRASTGPRDLRTVGNQFSTVVDYASTNRRIGRRHRAGGGLRWQLANVQVVSEYNLDYQEEVRAASGARANVLAQGWLVGGSWVITGEEIKLRHDGHQVTPDAPFYDPETKSFGLGAFELALRYEQTLLERKIFRRGLATGTDRIQAATVTGHWYAWKNVRLSVSYTYTALDDRVLDSQNRAFHDEHTILTRFAVWF